MANEITVAAPPTANDVASQILASMASLSGVLTDYNPGSQIRTLAESIGAVVEQQGITGLATALQAVVYSALSAFAIVPATAVPAIGTVTFATAPSSPPPATQNVNIPAGTIVQTGGGIQFATTAVAVLLAGNTSVNVAVQAVIGGNSGNVPPGAITQVVTGLTYPLSVTNAARTAEGADAESPAQALSQLASTVAAIGLGSPVSIANFAIGITLSGTTEAVKYSSVWESWIASGPGAGAGFTLYIDNGTGTASSGLINTVATALNGNQALNLVGNRPAGVPYTILAVQPVFTNVVVAGTVNSLGTVAQVSGAVATAVQQYFDTLLFGFSAYQTQIAAQISNAALGLLSALGVTLAYASASGVAVSAVSGTGYQRAVLQNLSIALTQGS